MTNQDVPIHDRMSASFERLSAAAADLNSASDELAQPISAIDEVLQMLNLGIPKWVTITGGGDGGDRFWSRDIGYAKVGSKWGIALRTVDGYDYAAEEAHVEEWLFNEAPRRLRVEGVAKLPDLLEGLTKEATKIADEVRAKVAQAREVSIALTTAARAKAKAAAQRRK